MSFDPTWIVAALGILGTIFGIYSYFKEPQIKTDKNNALIANDIKAIRDDIINIRDNHIHGLHQSLDETNKQVNQLNVKVATLSTIIDERIPKKHE